MYWAFVVTYLLVPLILGAAFASIYQRVLHKPAWACFLVVAEGYGVAIVVSLVLSYRNLSKIDLSGRASYDEVLGGVGLTPIIALATLVVLNLALLSWNLRVLPKRD
jgi:hypothetical protein